MRNACARENHPTRKKATCGGEREKWFFSLAAACRLSSHVVIFTRARVWDALLSLRKNGGLLVVYSHIKNLPLFWEQWIKTGNRIDQWHNANFSTRSRVQSFRRALIWSHLPLGSLWKICLIETLRFSDEDDYEDDISSIGWFSNRMGTSVDDRKARGKH